LGIAFRRGTPDDAHGIATLLAAVAQERLWIGTVPPVDVDARAARIRASLERGTNVSFVLARDGAIAGEITLWGIDLSSIAMCIAADLRGRGWGGVLLDAAIAHASRMGRAVLSLGVYAHNAAARRLYASRGFVAVREPKREVRLDGEAFETIAMQRLMAGPERRAVIERVADAICRHPDPRRVAIDGTDGAGKTCFAAELAYELMRRGRAVVRASVDDFHHPRAIRYRRGRTSPEGFFADSFDYDALQRELLDPFGPAGRGRFRRAIHDVDTDEAVEENDEIVPLGALLVLDGIFLHRDELCRSWDASVLLDVPFDVSIPRGARRGIGSPDLADPSNQRYIEGQRLYFERCRPASRATIVIDNTHLHEPRIVRA
jgi:uridine kinase